MKKFLLLTLILTLLAFSVNAFEFQRTEIYVNDQGILSFDELYIINQEDSLVLPEDFFNLEVKESNDFSYELNNNLIYFAPKKEIENIEIELSYSSYIYTYKDKDLWSIRIGKDELIKEEVNIITLYLPRNTVIKGSNENAEIFSLGNNLVINFKNLDEDLTIDYNLKAIGTKGINPILIILIIIAALLVIFLILKKKTKIKKPKVVKKADKEEKNKNLENIMKTLTENEAKIVRLLLEKSNLTQKKLLFLTVLPKSTLSRTLKKLELKKIIETRRVGISKVVSIANWLKKD